MSRKISIANAGPNKPNVIEVPTVGEASHGDLQKALSKMKKRMKNPGELDTMKKRMSALWRSESHLSLEDAVLAFLYTIESETKRLKELMRVIVTKKRRPPKRYSARVAPDLNKAGTK